jgi:hypothetical protein
MQDVLTRLSTICGQTGAMDYLEYFLTTTENLKKTPYLALVAVRPDVGPSALQAEDLLGAVLVYEYRVLGAASRVFSSSDFDGRRGVVAPLERRKQISAIVCRHLIERGAQVVHLSYANEGEEADGRLSVPVTSRKHWWTTQIRQVGATILLKKNIDDTLATLGKHTRRNLRYYRRKAEAELACAFAGNVKTTLSRAQLFELNGASTHPVAHEVLEQRYRAMKALSGVFCVGVKTPDGHWISLLGGRRHHGVSEIDWQMNRAGLEKYSVGTVIRAYLLEHEIEIGTEKLFFEGGTPHSMRHAFLTETATDILVMDRSAFAFVLRNLVRKLRHGKNFLLQMLSDSSLKWELR